MRYDKDSKPKLTFFLCSWSFHKLERPQPQHSTWKLDLSNLDFWTDGKYPESEQPTVGSKYGSLILLSGDNFSLVLTFDLKRDPTAQEFGAKADISLVAESI